MTAACATFARNVYAARQHLHYPLRPHLPEVAPAIQAVAVLPLKSIVSRQPAAKPPM